MKSLRLRGVGVHSGAEVLLRVAPAGADEGIIFIRSDVKDKDPKIAARYDLVTDTKLGTTITNADGVSVSTIEHLMAALWGAGIDNAAITIEGPEIPIMDGSSWPFVEAITKVGTTEQDKQAAIYSYPKTGDGASGRNSGER